MPTSDQDPISHWIAQFKAGNTAVAQPLWECYFDRLVRLARARFGPGGAVDGEDVALSAFRSLYTGLSRGRFPKLSDRHELWRLLVFITARKVCDYAEHRDALKRRPGVARQGGLPIEQIVGDEPTPEFAAVMAEQVQRLLRLLVAPDLRAIAVWKMEGDTNEEIAARLGCSLKTVSNKLRLIRLKWERETG